MLTGLQSLQIARRPAIFFHSIIKSRELNEKKKYINNLHAQLCLLFYSIAMESNKHFNWLWSWSERLKTIHTHQHIKPELNVSAVFVFGSIRVFERLPTKQSIFAFSRDWFIVFAINFRLFELQHWTILVRNFLNLHRKWNIYNNFLHLVLAIV